MRAPDTALRLSRAALLGLAVTALAAAGALALEEPPDGKAGGGKAGGGGPATVDDMDMPLLQRNLLKIYVCERESAINEARLAEYKVASETMGEYGKETLERPTPEQLEDMRKRHKYIFHYLLMEKTNAVQVVHIVDRILGTAVRLEGEDPVKRAILEKQIEVLDIARGTDFVQAARKIGEILGCRVEVELPPLQNYTLRIYMERPTGEAIIKQVCSQFDGMEWRIENGVLYFRHAEYFPQDTGGDEEDL